MDHFENEVDIDTPGGDLQTPPLYWATYQNHVYAVELLLHHGVDTTFVDQDGYSVYLLAIHVRIVTVITISYQSYGVF